MKLQVYTDFVKPTSKVEVLRVLAQQEANTRATGDQQESPLQRSNVQMM